MTAADRIEPTAGRLLHETPAYELAERVRAEAERRAGCAVGLYVLDLSGCELRRGAGREPMPEAVPIPQAVGPELPDREARRLQDGLEVDGRRLTLPPRIAGIPGAELAASILPAYDVGGDWFDYAETERGAWITLADAAGKGSRAAALSALTVGAQRAVRRSDGSLEDAAGAMHAVTLELGDTNPFMTAILAEWDADATVLVLTIREDRAHEPPLPASPASAGG